MRGLTRAKVALMAATPSVPMADPVRGGRREPRSRLDCQSMSCAPSMSMPEEVADKLLHTLSLLVAASRRNDVDRVARGDLTLVQLSMLQTLFDEGPIRVTDLAARDKVRAPTMTVAVSRLAKHGLVTRSRNPGDGREVLVGLTPNGVKTYRRSLASRRIVLGRRLMRLSQAELETLTRSLTPFERLVEVSTREPMSARSLGT